MPIKITDLNYVYSAGTPFAKHALKNINLEIPDGEFWGVIGHTGSGKSTLFAHLNALTRIQSGTIEIDEFRLVGNGGKKPKRKHRPDYKALRARVGMVFQYPEYQLFAETVAKDVEFGCRNIGIKDDECAERVKEAIELVGLDYEEIKDRSPFELSGGQKRRVALAGVLAMRPKILVLDEPTAGLDPRGKREILDLILKIRSSCPTTVMISHNMDEVAQYCNKIAVMSGGRLYGVFTPSELFSQKELLNSLSLGVPKVTSIAGALADRGFDIDRGIVKASELVEAISRAFGKEA